MPVAAVSSEVRRRVRSMDLARVRESEREEGEMDEEEPE
jgi:hypothetical protein